MKAELVFNLDEIGISEWEDRKDKKVIVPQKMDSQMMHHRASRNVTYILIITYITAGETSLAPYIVTSQDSEPVHRRMMSRVIRLGVNFVFRQRLKSYVSGNLFLLFSSIAHIHPFLSPFDSSSLPSDPRSYC
jgi:hypothetical protein